MAMDFPANPTVGQIYTNSAGTMYRWSGTVWVAYPSGTGDMNRAVYDINNDGIVDKAASIPWAGVSNTPATYPPSAHTHTASQITDLPPSFPSGTVLLFHQTNAPVGWTKRTDHNDKALRVVNGAVTAGGSLAFSSAFANRSVAGSSDSVTVGIYVNAHVLSIGQMAYHQHVVTAAASDVNSANSQGWVNPTSQSHGSLRSTDRNPSYYVNKSTGMENMSYVGGNEGHSHGAGSAAHSHSVSSSLNIAVTYIDVILATKD